MKALIVAVLLGLAAVPVAVIGTMLLHPLWSWIEATYGIESMGHSGPAMGVSSLFTGCCSFWCSSGGAAGGMTASAVINWRDASSSGTRGTPQ